MNKIFVVTLLLLASIGSLSLAQEVVPTPTPTPVVLVTPTPVATPAEVAPQPPAWTVSLFETIDNAIEARWPVAGKWINFTWKLLGFLTVVMTLLTGFLKGLSGGLQGAGVAAGKLDWALKVQQVFDKIIYWVGFISNFNVKKPSQ